MQVRCSVEQEQKLEYRSPRTTHTRTHTQTQIHIHTWPPHRKERKCFEVSQTFVLITFMFKDFLGRPSPHLN